MDSTQLENLSLASPPSQLNGISDQVTLDLHSSDGDGSSDQVTLDLHSSDGASGEWENSPKPNGFSGIKSSNRRIKMLRSSENHCRRRSPRFVGESNGKEVDPTKLDCFSETSPPSKKHKSGRKFCFFVGEPVPEDEARRRWPWRYEKTKVCVEVMWFHFGAVVILLDCHLY